MHVVADVPEPIDIGLESRVNELMIDKVLRAPTEVVSTSSSQVVFVTLSMMVPRRNMCSLMTISLAIPDKSVLFNNQCCTSAS